MKKETLDKGVLEHWTPGDVADSFADNEIVLIDVRTPQEFSFERINGALLAPMQAFQAAHMPSQNDKPILFYCGSGARSKKVAEQYLESQGGTIAHMKGGFGAWKDAGLNYVGTDMMTGAPKEMCKEN